MTTSTLIGQTVRPFLTPAYQYLRETDKLPSTDEAHGQDDPWLLVKLFTPDSSWTWYVAGYDHATHIAWGLVDGFEQELGDFWMPELVEVRGAFRLPIERDLHWQPKRLSDVMKET